jgi:3D (Asp-Asp-Asp) domain-containing protein
VVLTRYVVQPAAVKTSFLGTFRITYYDACVKCCGKTDGITKSGAHVEKGVTVAVDPDVIPLGSYLYIEGIGFRVAQDTGNGIKDNSVDIYVPTHSEAVKNGVEYGRVYLIKEGELPSEED